MTKLKNPKQIQTLTILFACTYMVSYITRTNYGTIISEMQRETAIPKSLLSMALTGSFITYGIGQIISGILGDRISPKKLVSYGFIITILMNLSIPLCQNPYQMLAVWCVNGFAQSFMWPPLVKIMAELLPEDAYKNTVTKVCWGSSAGTILLYLVSPLIISVLSWRWVFLFSAACGILMLFIWNKYSYDIENNKKADNAKKETPNKTGILMNPVMLGIMAAIILQGMLRDGVTTWMPSYISETYHLSNVVSILTGVVLPVFSILCFQAATKLYVKRFKNPIACASLFFLSGGIVAFVLYLSTGKNTFLSILFSALLTGCMHGVNLLLISMIPPFFQKYGNISTVSGVLNSCTYIGSAISTYGIAVLSEQIGWHDTVFLWFLIAVSGTVICLFCCKPWAKKYI